MLHGACVGEEAGARNLVFFRVKWLQPAMKGTSCVRRLRLRSFRTRLIPPLCAATSGCVCVRSSMRFLNLWLQIALEWLHDCCHLVLPCAMRVESCRLATGCCDTHYNGCMNVAWGLCWGGSRSTKPCVFPCKVAAAGDERYLVCAAVAAAVVLQRVVVSVCVVLCVSWIYGCRSHWNGCMIVVIWCCHACREMQACYGMLRHAL